MFWKKEKKHDCCEEDDFIVQDSGVFVHDGQITGYWQSKKCKICERQWQKCSGIGSAVSLSKKLKNELTKETK